MGHEYKGCTQIAINNALILPEYKPDIEFLLRVTSTPFLAKTIVVDKKIIFSGHILIGVEYVASVSDCSQPMHFVSFEAPFNGFIDSNQARACMSAQLNASVEFQDFHPIDQRTIHKLIIVKFRVIKISKTGESLPCHCCLPFSTICKPDKPLECNDGAHPCSCPPDPPKQKCYISSTQDCEQTHDYESNTCTICGCSMDQD